MSRSRKKRIRYFLKPDTNIKGMMLRSIPQNICFQNMVVKYYYEKKPVVTVYLHQIICGVEKTGNRKQLVQQKLQIGLFGMVLNR